MVDFGRLASGEIYVRLDDREFLTEIEPAGPCPEDWPSNYFDKVVPWDPDVADNANVVDGE